MPIKRFPYRTRPISISTLLSDMRYFHTFRNGSGGGNPQYTYTGRYPNHQRFLESHKHEIKVFADVGCALKEEAPTTIEAKEALGKNAKVYAVDVFGLPTLQDKLIWPSLEVVRKNRNSSDYWEQQHAKEVLDRAVGFHKIMLKKIKKSGIIPKVHSIVKSPLPFKCDAIRFANAANHMNQSERRRAFVNIWKSLKMGGYLIGATEQHYMGYAPNKQNEFFLRKTSRGFEEIMVFKDDEVPSWQRKDF